MAEIIQIHKPPRMRGIKEAIAELKALDPETAFTEHALRVMIWKGEIPSVRCGQKYLINMETLTAYLAKGSTEPKKSRRAAVEYAPVQGIRKIRE